MIRDTFTQTAICKKTNYRDIVREVPPKGSQFTTRGGYITPDGAHIPQKLRMRVWELRSKYSRRDPSKHPAQKVDLEDFEYVGKNLSFFPSSSKN